MSDTPISLLKELLKDARACYCYERPTGGQSPWCLPCRVKAALAETQPWEDEREALRSALAKCLKLIEEMSRYSSSMALSDYTLLNEAPIAARNLLEGFVPDGNKLRPLVKRFAQEMERKLRRNDHKDGCFADEQEIMDRIYQEMVEITQSMRNNSGMASLDECADVGNFCAMLAGYMRSEWPGVNDK